MTSYALLVGAGGWFPTIATGGTITTENIGGIDYNVHTFTTSGTFTITSAGSQSTIEAFLWGGGGGLGGFTDVGGISAGRNGGDGGGAAYARNLGISISAESLSVCVGGAGGAGTLSGGSGGGAAGTGITIGVTNYYFGGRGGNAGSSGFSGGGGGAGAASSILRSTTGLIVASGGGGGGGSERSVQAGNGGGGGNNGTSGTSGGGGTAGASGWMPLNLINIRPGFNKQITDTAAEGQYVDGDFVRFRYGLPEKIGGWEKITSDTIVGELGHSTNIQT
jgi:hypothetical protein